MNEVMFFRSERDCGAFMVTITLIGGQVEVEAGPLPPDAVVTGYSPVGILSSISGRLRPSRKARLLSVCPGYTTRWIFSTSIKARPPTLSRSRFSTATMQ